MLFVQQYKLLPFLRGECGERRTFRSVNPSCGFGAKFFSCGGKGYQLFTKAVRRRLRFNEAFGRKLFYAGINRLLAQVPYVAELFLGARPPKLIDSAENVKGCIRKAEFFRQRMIQICASAENAVNLCKLIFYSIYFSFLRKKVYPVIIVRFRTDVNRFFSSKRKILPWNAKKRRSQEHRFFAKLRK